MLVIALFDGIGACRVALDVLGAQVAGYVAVEQDVSARRVVESSFASVEFIESVQEVNEELVRSLACSFSRVGVVLISGGPPCQGVSGLNDSRLGSERDPRSKLHHEIPRVRELVKKYFNWACVHVLMESVASMGEDDRSAMTPSIGILPYEIDAAGISPCRRNRLFWFTWKVEAEPNVEIMRPLTAECHDYERISFLLPTPPDPYLAPRWALAGGSGHKLPTFTTSPPKAGPGFEPAGIGSCTSRDLEYWREDNFRFPRYQYKYQRGLVHPRKGWRLPTVNEREVMLGFPLDYTLQCQSKSSRKQDPAGLEHCRLSLLGNSWSVPVVAFLLERCLKKFKICEPHTAREIQSECQPGQASSLSSFLSRPPWQGS